MLRASIAICCVLVLGLVATAQLSTSHAPKKDSQRDHMVQISQGGLDDLRLQAAVWRHVAIDELSKHAPRNAATGELFDKDRFEAELQQRYDKAADELKRDVK